MSWPQGLALGAACLVGATVVTFLFQTALFTNMMRENWRQVVGREPYGWWKAWGCYMRGRGVGATREELAAHG